MDGINPLIPLVYVNFSKTPVVVHVSTIKSRTQNQIPTEDSE